MLCPYITSCKTHKCFVLLFSGTVSAILADISLLLPCDFKATVYESADKMWKENTFILSSGKNLAFQTWWLIMQNVTYFNRSAELSTLSGQLNRKIGDHQILWGYIASQPCTMHSTANWHFYQWSTYPVGCSLERLDAWGSIASKQWHYCCKVPCIRAELSIHNRAAP